MKIGSIFDEDFKQELIFSLSKPNKWGPAGSFSVGIQNASVTPDSSGKCLRDCVPKICECTQGDCPESECWGSYENCRCFDELTAAFEGASAGLGARCERGTYCFKNEDGSECTTCCQPGPGLQTCLADWKEAKRGDANNQIGGWNKGNTCPEEQPSILTEGEGSTSGGSTGGSCGCSKGRCIFKLYGALPVPLDGDALGNWYWYCLEDTSRENCESQMNGVSKIWFNSSIIITERALVSFKCCSTLSDWCPECDRSECPEDGVSSCESNERLAHRETNDGILDNCLCLCLENLRTRTSGGEYVCVSCGNKSTWNAESGKCECDTDYETLSGGDGYSLSEMTIEDVSGRPDKRATSPPCVSKSYMCSHVKAEPFYSAYGNPMWIGSCVPVDKEDKVAGKEYYADKASCESAGCETGKSGYVCVNGECTPSEVPEAEGGSGSYPNIDACRLSCEMYACVDKACVHRDGSFYKESDYPTFLTFYPSKKACTDGIAFGDPPCGSKWFCSNAGVGKCTQSSFDNPIPAGAREFDDEAQCMESCNKWFCNDSGVCQWFDGSGSQPDPTNNVLFDYEFQCNASGCGKYYCDDLANECKTATESKAQGEANYYDRSEEGLQECYAACTCPKAPQQTYVGWVTGGNFGATCTEPAAGSPCSAYQAYMSCLRNSCNFNHENCYETAQDVYLSCTGGVQGCVQVKTYSGSGDKIVTACRKETYRFIGDDLTVIQEVGVCIREPRSEAERLNHTIINGDCDNPSETHLVSFPEGGEIFFITYTPC